MSGTIFIFGIAGFILLYCLGLYRSIEKGYGSRGVFLQTSAIFVAFACAFAAETYYAGSARYVAPILIVAFALSITSLRRKKPRRRRVSK